MNLLSSKMYSNYNCKILIKLNFRKIFLEYPVFLNLMKMFHMGAEFFHSDGES